MSEDRGSMGGRAPAKEGEDGTAKPGDDSWDDPLTDADKLSRQQAEGPIEFALPGKAKDFTLRYACLSQRGLYPDSPDKANQDSYIVLPNFGAKGDIVFGVFDGHGKYGDFASLFVRGRIEKELKAAVKKNKKDPCASLSAACVQMNKDLLKDAKADESGTTAVTAYFNGGKLHVANVGDSRIVLGQRKGDAASGELIAVDLSNDQTPFRKDERDRCKAAGAMVRTIGMIDGAVKYTKKWEDALGKDDEQNNGDPPRLFRSYVNMHGAVVPGVCFTRSIGDKIANDIGVHGEPELESRELSEADQLLLIASDGVFEFIPSQTVVDMAARYDNPLDACKAIVAESYKLWLTFDDRTDDITVILAMLDHKTAGRAPRVTLKQSASSAATPWSAPMPNQRRGSWFNRMQQSFAPRRGHVHEPEDHVARDPTIVESVLRRLSLSGRRPSAVGPPDTNLLDTANKDPLAA